MNRAIRTAGLMALAAGLVIGGAGDAALAKGKKKNKGEKAGKAEYFNRIATLPVYLNTDIGIETVSEIVAASTDGKTLVYTDSQAEKVGFVDISDPENPVADGTIALNGEPTSVAVSRGYALVAVNTSADFVNVSGELVVVDIKKREIVATFDLGGQPDSVAVSPNDQYAAIVIENERDEDLGDGAPPQAPAGLLQVLRMKGNKTSKWSLAPVDLTGIADKFPTDPEPEFVDINKRNVAVVSLQENNHIVLVDLKTAAVIGDFPAGEVDLTDIDATEDDQILLAESLSDVPREPDAIQWYGKDEILTANEGDLEGGSRGFSIFDDAGNLLFDSGNETEHLAVRYGHYPESRSENKGAEIEGAEIAKFGRDEYAFLGSERGNFVLVYRLGGDRPEFVQLLPTNNGPEGLVAIPKRKLFVAACEVDDAGEGLRSALQIYRLEKTDAPAYPQILSGDDADGKPIPWGALSGLAADREDADIVYAVTDSYYVARPRILKIDVSSKPARIIDEIVLFGGATQNTAGYDLEGVVQRDGGGFWLASEGKGTRENLLLEVAADGEVLSEVSLPAATAALKTSNGFEGVTVIGSGDDEVVYAAIQREWSGDPDGSIRVGEYTPLTGEWRFFYYPKSAPTSSAGGWVGLSEIVAVDDSTLAFIERDNQRGLLASIKWITEVSLDGLTPVAEGGSFPTATKMVVRDLLPDLETTNGWTQDKVEGLAIGIDGQVYVVTDNDGVDDSTGETRFFWLGDYDSIGNVGE